MISADSRQKVWEEDFEEIKNLKKNTLDKKLFELQETLQRISMRLSRVEETLNSPHDCFSHSYFSEMTRTLSMPGLRFIGEKSQHGFHSYLWLLVHVVALFVSYNYIVEEYDNWQTSPVIRTLSNNLSFVEEIPFPAVTICVPNSLKREYDFLGDLEKCLKCNSTAGKEHDCFFNRECDKGEIEALTVASTLCEYFENSGIAPKNPSTVYTKNVSNSIDGELFAVYAKKVFPSCDFSIIQQKNQDEEISAGCGTEGHQYFLAFGAYGWCTTINGLRHEDIYKENVVLPIPMQPSSYVQNYIGGSLTLENMLYFNGRNDTVPAYFFDDDYFTFTISKRENQRYHNACNAFPHVASVILHNPAEIPLVQDLERFIHTDKYNYMKVIPNVVITKKDLISYSPEQRGCYYSHERELMMFKRYNEASCDAECWVNCSLQACNCAPHFMPKPNSSVRVCVTECKAKCDCGCLPDCISLKYDFEARKETKETGTNGTGVLFVYYKSNSFYPMIRVGINDLADFMAYIFGILGTFNGFSVMVIFELLYFVTIRLWSSVKNMDFKG